MRPDHEKKKHEAYRRAVRELQILNVLVGYFKGIRGPLMVAQWLRYCATNRKVAGSIPDGVIGIFH
jgi:hypothetical protein